MSLLKELKDAQDLTEREITLRDYLLAHPESVLHMSSRQLGKATFTSAPTVTRFCKKFDCEGWPDFKLRFISDLKTEQGSEASETVELLEEESLVTVLQKVSGIYDQALEDTRKALSLSQLLRIRKLLLEHPYIDFYAYDTNIYLARYSQNQFFHAGKIRRLCGI